MKWFDLARFGAKLTVLPKSDVRSRTVLRLEMEHSRDWINQRDITAAKTGDPSIAERFTPNRFYAALNELGFSEMKATRLASATREQFDHHGSEYPAYVTEAVRDSIKLSELQTIMPGLAAADIVDMPLEKVLALSEDFLGNEAKWEGLRKTLVNDSIGVFVPNHSPWNQGDKPVPIMQALEAAGLDMVREDRNKTLPIALTHQANLLGYRDDALVTYYVSEKAAQADGLKEGEYHRAGCAASVPLMVAGEGKVIALRDIWAMPDVRHTISPAKAFDLYGSQIPLSLITGYLRELEEFRVNLRSSLNQLNAWIENPSLLENKSSDMVWGQVAVFAEGNEIAKRYKYLDVHGIVLGNTVLENTSNGVSRLKKPGAIDSAGYELLAKNVASLGIDSKENALDTLRGARLLWQKMLNAEMAAERTSAMTRDSQESPKPIVSSEESQAAIDKRKHVDVGEKIGGARKDYAKLVMERKDLLSMNDAEIKLHVNKQNIWPPLDYAAMRERGMDAKVAMGLKLIKDSLNTVPTKWQGMDDRECANQYIETIGNLRNIFEDVKTADDLRNAVKKAVVYAQEDDERLMYGGKIWYQMGRDASKVINGYSDVLNTANRKIEKATRSYNYDTKKYEYKDPWTALIKERKINSEAELAERKRKTAMDRELHVPHLARVQRFGENWREERDVTADELLEKFGFRAIEYGEWLPQKERQEVINMAYDSFADLAQALNLRPIDVSLGGELAVAFGARGTGGIGAALAHFEPARFAMNLTRMKGAGSLAHEWFHAFDRKIAQDEGDKTLYASEAKNPSLKSLEVLSRRMSWENADPDELAEKAASSAARSRRNAESWVHGVDEKKRGEAMADLSDALESVKTELQRRVNTILETNNSYNRFYGDAGVIGFHVLSELAGNVRGEMASKWRGQLKADSLKHIEGNVWHYGKNESLAITLQAFKDRNQPVPEELLGHKAHQNESQYAKDAALLDKQRSSAYWNTTRELFARAGAAYVQDKLEEMGARSDYLVHGAGDGRKVVGLEASPNPSGEDRVALKACFDTLMDEYRAKLTQEVSADMTP